MTAARYILITNFVSVKHYPFSYYGSIIASIFGFTFSMMTKSHHRVNEADLEIRVGQISKSRRNY
jgi:hypothetical protein